MAEPRSPLRRRVLASPRIPAWLGGRAARPVADAGGMIAIGGPPLAGKSLVAARLAEAIPGAMRLEAVDDLSGRDPHWQPAGPGTRRVHNPTRALLGRAQEIWEARDPSSAPVLLISSRFGSPGERRRLARAARAFGMRFLFVEARSRHVRALRRIPVHRLSESEMQERFRRYQEALSRYQPVSSLEARQLPAVRLARVHSGLEQAVARVLRAWGR